MSDPLKQTILVIDDQQAIRNQLYWALEENYNVLQASSRTQAIQILERELVDVVLTDLHMPPNDQDISEGLGVLEAARRLNPALPVIVISGDDEHETAIKVVIQKGAYDFFQKPFNVEQVEYIVRRAANFYRLYQDNIALRSEDRSKHDVVGSSPALTRILDQAHAVSDTSATVLITGESGTGKEVLARFIHNTSPRATKPFIACNIAALPESLIESELFGHEKGAYTGAQTRRQGRFELADGGTLFLDEIGELTPAMQVKLLRVLQERQFERLGGKELLTVDIRVIAATNRNLEEMVENGQFRADLYYRLNIVNLELPPLRERPDDVPILANHFALKAARKHGRNTPSFTPAFLNRLQNYRWPGNIRELENVIERAVVISTAPVMDESVLPNKVLAESSAAPVTSSTPSGSGTIVPIAANQPTLGVALINDALPPDLSFETAIQSLKRDLVRQALRECNNSRSEAAHRLKISRQYLHRLINELNVEG
ncbi:MAG: sigma-54-dependent Fis family transcriptional regulator [Acidobacteria bacterium]|nr:sigma-54-dependent Fis family transcriptional regulator [Acidobacteriota bacterium]MBI3423791.1 sigma-54-dependent Fis family transcriptional regulator [Acidobacteriota bacterium]